MGTMRRPKSLTILFVGGLTVLVALLVVSPSTVRIRGADHREAPLISEDPAADIRTCSRSSTRTTRQGRARAGREPLRRPRVRSSYSFSNDVLYQIKIDNRETRRRTGHPGRFEGYESFRDPRVPRLPVASSSPCWPRATAKDGRRE